MQLSMLLLPAPLGPMMARISCSRTLKLMSVSAFTPPKARLMFLTSRMTSPLLRSLTSAVMSGGLLHRGKGLGIGDLQRGRDRAAATVLELHRRLDVLLGLAAIQRVDQHQVLVEDGPALDLAGACHLAVVGVQFLVQDQEARDLAACQQCVLGQVGV